MGYSLFNVSSGRIYQVWRSRELDRTLRSQPPQPAPHAATSYRPGSAIGRLEIPRVGLSVVVLEGSDTGTLRLGVGRLRSSSIPGAAGNVVLAGHRDTFFRSLRTVRPGDRISLETPQGTFPYTVDWTKVVNPTDTSVLLPTPSAALTLVTCYPFSYIGPAPKRFIVRALPPGTAPSAAIAAPLPVHSPAVRRPARRPTPAAAIAPAPPAAVLTPPPVTAPETEGPAAAAFAPAEDAPAAPAPPPVPQSRRITRVFRKLAAVFQVRRVKLQ